MRGRKNYSSISGDFPGLPREVGSSYVLSTYYILKVQDIERVKCAKDNFLCMITERLKILHLRSPAKILELMTEFPIDFRNRTLYAEKQLG
jgi:hypothetical protein